MELLWMLDFIVWTVEDFRCVFHWLLIYMFGFELNMSLCCSCYLFAESFSVQGVCFNCASFVGFGVKQKNRSSPACQGEQINSCVPNHILLYLTLNILSAEMHWSAFTLKSMRNCSVLLAQNYYSVQKLSVKRWTHPKQTPYWWRRGSYITNFSTFKMVAGHYSRGFSCTTDMATECCHVTQMQVTHVFALSTTMCTVVR